MDNKAYEEKASARDLEVLMRQADGFMEYLAGRILLTEEVVALVARNQLQLVTTVDDMLQFFCAQKMAEAMKGIEEIGEEGPICCRCGSGAKLRWAPCMNCGESHCAYCEGCAAMGLVRQCKTLYAFGDGQPRVPLDVQCRLPFSFSKTQSDAAADLLAFGREEKGRECLVWAACGAGKTEVAFPLMAEALRRGERVLFAVPRRDTLRDIEMRVREAFQGVSLAVLYGGSKEKYDPGAMILATTHQVIRFHKTFDLVVLDEVDAFPFHGSPMLYYALTRACREEGRLVYMTATPPDWLRQRPDHALKRIILPVRHHGHPLPVPELVIDNSLAWKQGKATLTKGLVSCLHESVERDFAQVFIFVPTIAMAVDVQRQLAVHFPQGWVQCIHSKDPQREEKRVGFVQGEYPILVTTTLMERGINIPRVHVVVLFADAEYIFDTPALVQMAGRSGRHIQHPLGRVWYWARQETPGMRAALVWITTMNQEAQRRGALVSEKKGVRRRGVIR